MYHSIGNTGTAAVLMMLAFALDEARPGDVILAANYGDGADAFVLRVTENIKLVEGERRIMASLERKIPINYETYLSWRDLVPTEEPRHPEPRTSSITYLPLAESMGRPIFLASTSASISVRMASTAAVASSRACGTRPARIPGTDVFPATFPSAAFIRH